MENQLNMENYYINEQNKLLLQLDLNNQVNIGNLHLIAGVDLAYWKENEKEYAVCCIVVLNYRTKVVIERKYNYDQITVPYIPGCLAFREIPLVMRTVRGLENEPDLYVFDGNGYLHPRHMGLATHAGILLNKPSIGVAKSYFKVENVDYAEPENECFAYKDIVIHDEVFGRALRTQKNVRPVFISVGNKIDLQTSMEVIKNMVNEESHVPLPTRLADLMTHEKRKEYQFNSGMR